MSESLYIHVRLCEYTDVQPLPCVIGIVLLSESEFGVARILL